MLNIFSTLKTYAGKWEVKDRRGFTDEEKSAVIKAEIVPSEYGSSVCFFMRSGGQTYIPLDQTSSKGIGETIDLNAAELVTLEKAGEADIVRVKA